MAKRKRPSHQDHFFSPHRPALDRHIQAPGAGGRVLPRDDYMRARDRSGRLLPPGAPGAPGGPGAPPRAPGIPGAPGGAPGRPGDPCQVPQGPPIYVCLDPCCLQDLVLVLEQVLMTSKGARVAGPPSCTQPVSASDLDKWATNRRTPGTDPVGTELILLTFRQSGRAAAIKGFGFYATLYDSALAADPYLEVEFTIKVNGRPHPIYREMNYPLAGGLQALTASTIMLRDGDRFEMVCRRTASPGHNIAVGARVKGWEWLPAHETARESFAL